MCSNCCFCHLLTNIFYTRNVEELRLENIDGFILNVPSDYKLGGFIPFNINNHKHWIAVKKIGDSYYNLDSKLKSPQTITSILTFLKEQLMDKNRELLIVVSKQVELSSSWKASADS